MSLKKIEQAKSDRGFKIWDLVIYGGVILLAAALFIAVFLSRDTSPLKGIRISVKNEVVYEYDFKKGEISRTEAVEIISDDGDLIVLDISAGGGYNRVEINKNGWVRITSADCSSRDCVYTPKIADNGGVIYCRPHNLKIVPFDYDLDNGTLIQ